MSTHYWDEAPQGLWTLGLENKGYYFNTGESCLGTPPSNLAPGWGFRTAIGYPWSQEFPQVSMERLCVQTHLGPRCTVTWENGGPALAHSYLGKCKVPQGSVGLTTSTQEVLDGLDPSNLGPWVAEDRDPRPGETRLPTTSPLPVPLVIPAQGHCTATHCCSTGQLRT
jgi:hypothetical protein